MGKKTKKKNSLSPQTLESIEKGLDQAANNQLTVFNPSEEVEVREATEEEFLAAQEKVMADPAMQATLKYLERFDKAEAASEKIWNVNDAARQMIKNYKDTWWPSIHKMALTYNVKEFAAESECRDLFLKWGATLK